jgi:hypothetical protein
MGYVFVILASGVGTFYLLYQTVGHINTVLGFG